MFKSFFVCSTVLTVLLSLGGEYAGAQQRRQNRPSTSSNPSDAEVLGVQEVGIRAWQPQPKQLPDPQEISVGLPPQVKLTPGPDKPGEVPENEDHRGIQVKVLNP
ncbi:hypothetical protein [Acaryochloris sp. IP29b_bin.137]|uniref:hypothetical protein n=1 Tax=Acaryochloris sp. IP29b_bin.137 TaxID=2969217 RepID=UPI00263651DA|nr:hypothetical protein [Acaryochloris sp. IP29b_bin.137]